MRTDYYTEEELAQFRGKQGALSKEPQVQGVPVKRILEVLEEAYRRGSHTSACAFVLAHASSSKTYVLSECTCWVGAAYEILIECGVLTRPL